MSAVGPSLPPHLSKRKRSSDFNEECDPSTSTPRQARSYSTSSNESTSKKRRVIGPSLPPAPLSERPSTPPSLRPSPDHDEQDEQDSSDDDFGPSLPSATISKPHPAPYDNQNPSATSTSSTLTPKPQREDWMLHPPTSSDWTSRIDPTRLRNRKFQTGKGAKAPPTAGEGGGNVGTTGGGGIGSTWTETADQKRQRLADEAMGVRKPAQLSSDSAAAENNSQDERRAQAEEQEQREMERRVREYTEKHRGGSLYDAHSKQGPRDKDDDPSARAFDREKDIVGGMKIGHKARRDMMERAKGMGDRFAKGKYL